MAHYFADSETIKGHVYKFLSNLLIAPHTEKLSYKNADEWIEKLSEILWSIPEDKWIEHKFDIESGVSGIAGQEIPIQSQNIVSYIKFLIRHPGFQHYQNYEPYHVYNQIKDQVYNEMYIGNW